MLRSAYCFLDVNLAIRGEVNLISMAGKTLGVGGKAISWTLYLFLLYALIAAYIAACAPLFDAVIAWLLDTPGSHWISPFLLPVLFGSFIYLGTGGVDVLNRLLMAGLFITYLCILLLLPAHVHVDYWLWQRWEMSYIALPVVITAFGYHIIIPTLTTYLQHDKRHLKLTLIIGSLIPFVVYLLWQLLTLGVASEGDLQAAWVAGTPLVHLLFHAVPSPVLRGGVQAFSFFAVTTSFLGVSLSLSDFLIDGFHIKRSREGRFLALLLVFIPPLIFVFTYERSFIKALEYAGAFVALLLGVIPALMAWTLDSYRKASKRCLLVVLIVAFLTVAFLSVYP